jgi:hypothetical protein|tara:strand:+ start:224 stop:397 length:174 start_codon:yes stop_codon:yes gene_type:complete
MNNNLHDKNLKKNKIIKNLLNKSNENIEDKIVTVKVSKKIDSDRFQKAFNKLLNSKK